MPDHDISFGYQPGQEIGYDEITGNVTISSTTEATGTLVVQGSEYLFDGKPVIAEFYCASVQFAPSGVVILMLWEGGTELHRWGDQRAGGAINPAFVYSLRFRFTPSAGRHTYKVTGLQSGGNATVNAGSGSGGSGTYPPTFLRFTKV